MQMFDQDLMEQTVRESYQYAETRLGHNFANTDSATTTRKKLSTKT